MWKENCCFFQKIQYTFEILHVELKINKMLKYTIFIHYFVYVIIYRGTKFIKTATKHLELLICLHENCLKGEEKN